MVEFWASHTKPKRSLYRKLLEDESMTTEIDKLYHRSLVDPDGFWAEAAEGIDWYKKWDTVLDTSNRPFYRWFQGGELNTCHNALDRHIDSGRAEQGAQVTVEGAGRSTTLDMAQDSHPGIFA